ncbi:major tail protein [Klebsiella phage VLCpiS13b]|uniref:major tail protein n=1 Tax=Klebsiella phage VLCpiS13b TaxID=2874886 RepID=UPI00233E8D9D|nr:major tail protein [Klebsiella phage VLCpiS13b]UVX30621.1 major tail protein [Klebsiella phage VLCpiS13b]
MAICANDNGIITGRQSLIELADGCWDAVPAEEDWKFFAPMTSKGVDFSPSTTTSEADDGDGFVATLVTTADLTISGDFEVRKADKADEYGVHNLIKYFVAEVKARRQPSVWVRQTTGNTVVVAYCNITALSYDGGTNDIITGSVEFKPYDGSTVDVFSIEDLTLTTDIAATKSVATGATLTLGPVVAAGGVEPYTYQWYKGTSPISGATTDTFTKATAAAGDAGTYFCRAMDSATSPDSVDSTKCVVTVTGA